MTEEQKNELRKTASDFVEKCLANDDFAAVFIGADLRNLEFKMSTLNADETEAMGLLLAASRVLMNKLEIPENRVLN